MIYCMYIASRYLPYLSVPDPRSGNRCFFTSGTIFGENFLHCLQNLLQKPQEVRKKVGLNLRTKFSDPDLGYLCRIRNINCCVLICYVALFGCVPPV
jgi:hypothetical protein